jgi:hypothetical protein
MGAPFAKHFIQIVRAKSLHKHKITTVTESKLEEFSFTSYSKSKLWPDKRIHDDEIRISSYTDSTTTSWPLWLSVQDWYLKAPWQYMMSRADTNIRWIISLDEEEEELKWKIRFQRKCVKSLTELIANSFWWILIFLKDIHIHSSSFSTRIRLTEYRHIQTELK